MQNIINIYYSTKIVAINLETLPDGHPRLFGVSPRTLRNVEGLLHGSPIPEYRILALDGGGVRGLVEAVLLKELARRLPKPLHTYFDLVSGTSIGSVLACSVAMGKNMDDAPTMFLERSKDIFPGLFPMVTGKLLRTPLNPFGPPLYDGKGLEKLLKDVFGYAYFDDEDLSVPVLIPAYSLTESKPVYMRSDVPPFSSYRIWEVCRSACAAPYFFPPFELKRHGQSQVMIDGALFANNPIGSALAQARMAHRLLDISPNYLIVSFGTVSELRLQSLDLHMGKGNVFEWIRWIIYTIFDSNTKDTNLRIQQSIGDENFFRFQVELPTRLHRIDNATPENLQNLIKATYAYLALEEIKAQLDRLVERLTSPH